VFDQSARFEFKIGVGNVIKVRGWRVSRASRGRHACTAQGQGPSTAQGQGPSTAQGRAPLARHYETCPSPAI
jgi:hypothetical protein